MTRLITTTIFFGLALPLATAAATYSVSGSPTTVDTKERRQRVTYYALDKPLEITTDSGTLELVFRARRARRHNTNPAPFTVTIERDGTHQIIAEIDLAAGSGKPLKVAGGELSPKVVRQIEVPAGRHRYEIEAGASAVRIMVRFDATAKADPTLGLGPESPIPGTEPPPPEPAPAPAPAPPPAPATPPPAPTPVAESAGTTPPPLSPATGALETTTETVSAETTGEAKKEGQTEEAARGSTTDPTPETLQLDAADPNVAGAVHTLAKTVKQRFDSLGREVAFHRVAVPYFEEVGRATQEHNLGRLVAELLAVELSGIEPFVVIERERLQQIMKEHRLTGLGIVDESTAAELGKVLGAQSLISGTVTEAGAQFVVTVRQVEVESGKVLVAGQVAIDRAGLVALSADAVVLRSKTGALFRSALIPGWGQIYNDQPVKSGLFFAAGLGTIAAGLGCLIASLDAAARYQTNTADTVQHRATANQLIDAANLLFVAYGVVWAVNVVDAYLSGADSTTIDVNVFPGAAAFSF